MQLVKLINIIRNSKKLGKFIYQPIVKIDNDYWLCESIVSQVRLLSKDVPKEQLTAKRILDPIYYKANGLSK